MRIQIYFNRKADGSSTIIEIEQDYDDEGTEDASKDGNNSLWMCLKNVALQTACLLNGTSFLWEEGGNVVCGIPHRKNE